MDEAFLDITQDALNANGVIDGLRDDNEFFSDFNNNETYNTKVGTLFQGTNCTDAAATAGHCASLVDVRDTVRLCMSGDNITVNRVDGGGADDASTVVDVSGGPQTVFFNFQDVNGLTPAEGTTISASAEDGAIVFGSSITVPNICSVGGFTSGISVKSPEVLTTRTGLLTLSVTQINGGVVRQQITLCHLGVTGGVCD